jgi:hypothetical protein
LQTRWRAIPDALRITVAERAEAGPGATDWAGYGALTGASLIWGSTFLVIAFSNEYLAPLWGATLRLAIASVGLIAVARLTRAAFPRGAQLREKLARASREDQRRRLRHRPAPDRALTRGRSASSASTA